MQVPANGWVKHVFFIPYLSILTKDVGLLVDEKKQQVITLNTVLWKSVTVPAFQLEKIFQRDL
jgi:hypothetical protein